MMSYGGVRAFMSGSGLEPYRGVGYPIQPGGEKFRS